jgi:hypothetical protein
MTRQYSSISVETTLASSINTTATTITVATGTATALMGGITLAPSNVDIFTVALDVDTVNEEIVFVTGVSGDTLTISRGQAGTGTAGVSGVAHTAGATVKHVLTSSDLIFFRNNASPVTSFAFSGSTSGTTTVQASAVAGTNTLTLPATSNDTLVGKATTDTLTNKTLTSPVISSISNSGTITVPTGTLTLASLTGAETLTNKTLTSPTINSAKINLDFNAQTGTSYTLVASDSSKLVTASNAAAITITIPPAIFTAGEQINLQQIGAGQVTFAAGVGVTITSTGATSAAPNLRAQFSACTVICKAANNFTIVGDLS